MKIGLIARAEDRGLGNLTREWYRHMDPDRTLVVRPRAADEAGLADHLHDWYPDPAVWSTPFQRELPEQLMRDFLDGLDIVYSAETFYDWRFCDLAREAGVTTVCHVMPEYFRHAPVKPRQLFGQPPARMPTAPPPADRWWNPTGYRMDRLPAGTRQVPVPVALDRFAEPAPFDGGPPTWLHVVGARAASDRNGTRVLLTALRHMREPCRVVILSQGEPFYPSGAPSQVEVKVEPIERADYWTLYEGAHGLVLPRRYGGLSLPAQEAMAAGLALVMPEVEPQVSEWPIIPVAASFENSLTTGAGTIPIAATKPRALAAILDHYSLHPTQLQRRREASLEWARANSWSALEPTIRGALRDAREQ